MKGSIHWVCDTCKTGGDIPSEVAEVFHVLLCPACGEELSRNDPVGVGG
jgi:predicted RNA-binding Zn-ribbon protein involved in translation (DUF1610 family)